MPIPMTIPTPMLLPATHLKRTLLGGAAAVSLMGSLAGQAAAQTSTPQGSPPETPRVTVLRTLPAKPGAEPGADARVVECTRHDGAPDETVQFTLSAAPLPVPEGSAPPIIAGTLRELTPAEREALITGTGGTVIVVRPGPEGDLQVMPAPPADAAAGVTTSAESPAGAVPTFSIARLSGDAILEGPLELTPASPTVLSGAVRCESRTP